GPSWRRAKYPPSREPQSTPSQVASARRGASPPDPSTHAAHAISAKPGPHQMSTMLASRSASDASHSANIATALRTSAVANRVGASKSEDLRARREGAYSSSRRRGYAARVRIATG